MATLAQTSSTALREALDLVSGRIPEEVERRTLRRAARACRAASPPASRPWWRWPAPPAPGSRPCSTRSQAPGWPNRGPAAPPPPPRWRPASRPPTPPSSTIWAWPAATRWRRPTPAGGPGAAGPAGPRLHRLLAPRRGGPDGGGGGPVRLGARPAEVRRRGDPQELPAAPGPAPRGDHRGAQPGGPAHRAPARPVPGPPPPAAGRRWPGRRAAAGHQRPHRVGGRPSCAAAYQARQRGGGQAGRRRTPGRRREGRGRTRSTRPSAGAASEAPRTRAPSAARSPPSSPARRAWTLVVDAVRRGPPCATVGQLSPPAGRWSSGSGGSVAGPCSRGCAARRAAARRRPGRSWRGPGARRAASLPARSASAQARSSPPACAPSPPSWGRACPPCGRTPSTGPSAATSTRSPTSWTAPSWPRTSSGVADAALVAGHPGPPMAAHRRRRRRPRLADAQRGPLLLRARDAELATVPVGPADGPRVPLPTVLALGGVAAWDPGRLSGSASQLAIGAGPTAPPAGRGRRWRPPSPRWPTSW